MMMSWSCLYLGSARTRDAMAGVIISLFGTEGGQVVSCARPGRLVPNKKKQSHRVFAPIRAFGVTLTQASTGDARHEYFDGTGAAWVKGEEDDEFFIVLTNNGTRPALCKVYVDGVHLGYDYQLTAGATTPPLGVLKSGQSFAFSSSFIRDPLH